MARKGEGTIESLEHKRQGYLGVGALVQQFEVVDGTRSLDEVAAEVVRLIEAFERTAGRGNVSGRR